jgi:hypothetical protein
MDSFETWLVGRIRAERMEMAELLRRRARKKMREAAAMRERGIDEGAGMSEEQKAELQVEWEDVVGEAQSLEYEARHMITEIADKRAQGFYHFFGLLSKEARTQFSGGVYLAYLELLPKQPKILIADVEKIARKHWDELQTAIVEAQDEAKKSTSPSGDSIPSKVTTTSEKVSTDTNTSTPPIPQLQDSEKLMPSSSPTPP